MHVRENTVSTAAAKSVLLQCPLCPAMLEAVFPYNCAPAQKARIRHRLIDEHRRVCVGGPAEVQRVYEIHYPRA